MEEDHISELCFMRYNSEAVRCYLRQVIINEDDVSIEIARRLFWQECPNSQPWWSFDVGSPSTSPVYISSDESELGRGVFLSDYETDEEMATSEDAESKQSMEDAVENIAPVEEMSTTDEEENEHSIDADEVIVQGVIEQYAEPDEDEDRVEEDNQEWNAISIIGPKCYALHNQRRLKTVWHEGMIIP